MSEAVEDVRAGHGMQVAEIAATDQPAGAEVETTAAFVGRTLRGPLNTPILLHDFAAFRRHFGGVWHRSSLGPAVQQFFEHGGRRLFVVRVANDAGGATIRLPAERGVLTLRAVQPGSTEKLRAAVDYDGIPDDDGERFNLTLQRLGPQSGLVGDQEIYRRLSCAMRDSAFIGHALAGSELALPQLPLPAGRPMPTFDPSNRVDPGYVTPAEQGSDGSALTDYDLIGSAVHGTGLFALNQVEHFDLLYLPPPGRRRDLGPAAVLAAEMYCRRRSAMLIMDPAAGWQCAADALGGIRGAGYGSPNMLTYFPRLTGGSAASAPAAAGAAIAGLLCRLDRRHGPWHDLERSDVAFRRGLLPAAEISGAERASLIRAGVNVVGVAQNGQATLRGSVTLGRNSELDRQFGSLSSRRLCLMITHAIESGTRWAVFDEPGPRLAERVEAQIDGYLRGLAGAGAFGGRPFSVRCHAGLSAGASGSRRGIDILLAFQPAGAGQAVSLALHQSVSGCRVALTAFAP